MNYFVEGIQGSGKSTLVRKLSERYPGYTTVMEGDYSPIELAWCARISEAQYLEVLEQWNDLQDQIRSKSHKEDNYWVVCYTQVKSDNRDFYQQLEKYEIYNGRTEFEEYKNIVLTRYRNWHGDGNIFECSLFQNAVRRERVDKDGSEVWFNMLMEFFINSPYAKKRSLNQYEDLFAHLRHRQILELRICREIFGEKVTVIKSKAYD